MLGAWVVFGVALIGYHALWERRIARISIEDGLAAVAEPPVEDPLVEMPRPTALPTHAHHFGEPEPMLVGTVRDSHGNVVPGSIITVVNNHGRQLVHATADHEGRYALTGLPETFVDVVASAPGMASSVRWVLVRHGPTLREDFVLDNRQALTTTRATG